jgi:hypothetical protein
VSSETSRPSRYQLADPARAGGEPGGAPAGPRRPSNPSWIKVIGTTLRLWLRRRVLRVPDSQRIGPRHAGRIAVVLAVVVVIAAGVAAIALTVHKQAAGGHRPHAAARLNVTPARAAAQAAAATAAQANGAAAARWIAAQVGRGLVIGCDPATCAAIIAAGYPTGGQVVLQPGVRLPGPGSLIVATAAVRAAYGARLDSLAPAVIASFGTGAEAVQVAVAVPGGQQAYGQAASKALTARRHAGRALLTDRKVLARGAIRTDLGSGRVDPRLITVLRKLAARYPVHLVHLGDTGPRAGRAMPFRMAQVAVPSSRGRHRRRSEHRRRSDLRGMEKLLRSQPARYRAELLPKRLAHGMRVLEIKFLAPSPV